MNSERDRRADGSDEIARLIAAAGKRPAPSAQMHESVRIAVEQAWSEAVSRGRFRRRSLWLAAAAAIGAIGFSLFWLTLRQPVAADSDATLLAARGEVTVRAPGDGQVIVAGSRLPVGTTVRTAPSGFVLMTVASVSMRIGPDSTVRIGGAGHVRLSEGRIYAETAASGAGGPPLVVQTPFGIVSHLGTQFQVQVSTSAMDVSVRSGRVRVAETDAREQTLTQGEGVQVLSGGDVLRMRVAPYGPSWAWADALVPDFPIDGRPLSEFLAWYAHETGLRLVLVGADAATAVRRTVLSGTIAGLTPDQALAAVMATTGLDYDTTVSGELRIRMRARAARAR